MRRGTLISQGSGLLIFWLLISLLVGTLNYVKGQDTLPNLKPMALNGWSRFLVVSTNKGDFAESDTFFPSQDIFVDWAVGNFSSERSVTNRFLTRLYVDNDLQHEWSVDALKPQFWFWAEDFNIGNLSPGIHQIWIHTDATDSVEESDEHDNLGVRYIIVGATNNVAPILLDLPELVIEKGGLLRARAWAYDPNTNDVLTYKLIGSVPPGMQINPQNGIITWKSEPTEATRLSVLAVEVVDNGTPPLKSRANLQVKIREQESRSAGELLRQRPFALGDPNMILPTVSGYKTYPSGNPMLPGIPVELSEAKAQRLVRDYFGGELETPNQIVTEISGNHMTFRWSPRSWQLEQSFDMVRWHRIETAGSLFLVPFSGVTRYYRISHPALAIFNHPVARSKIPSPTLRAALTGLIGTVAEPAIDYYLFERTSDGRPKVESVVFGDIESIARVEAAEFDEQVRVVVGSHVMGNNPFLITSILAHEALHQDHNLSVYEEAFSSFITGITYLQQLREHPELSLSGTELGQFANTFGIAVLNSGVGENLDTMETNQRSFLFRDGEARFQNFWEFASAIYSHAPEAHSPGNPLLESIINRLVQGPNRCLGTQFNIDLLQCAGANQTALSSEELVKVAKVLMLDTYGDARSKRMTKVMAK